MTEPHKYIIVVEFQRGYAVRSEPTKEDAEEVGEDFFKRTNTKRVIVAEVLKELSKVP